MTKGPNFFLHQGRLSSDVPPHLAQPCYVALGRALIWGLYPIKYKIQYNTNWTSIKPGEVYIISHSRPIFGRLQNGDSPKQQASRYVKGTGSCTAITKPHGSTAPDSVIFIGSS